MTTTADTQHDSHNADEDTVVVPRPQLPQPPHGYAPYGAPGYGPQYGHPYGPQYGQQPYAPLSAGFAAGFPAPAPRRGLAAVSRTTWIAVAAALTLIVVMVAVIVLATGSKGDTAQTPRRSADPTATGLVGPADLAPMLLTPAAIAELVGQPGTAALATPRRVRSTPNDTDILSNPACLPVAYPAEQAAYQGSGFTAMKVQSTVARPAKDQPQLWIYEQAATSYSSAEAAEKFVADSADRWRACENQTWSQRYDSGDTAFWASGQITGADGLLTVMNTQENGGGWVCWRGLKAHANAVMDFAVCGDTLPASIVPATAEAIARNSRPI